MPVCISEAVRPRDEVLPQGNADVPSRTTAGGFSFLLDLHSHFPWSKFLFENRAILSMLFRASLPLAPSRDSGTVCIPLTFMTVAAFRVPGLIAFPRIERGYGHSVAAVSVSRSFRAEL